MSRSKGRKSSRTEAPVATREPPQAVAAPRWPEVVIGILDGFDAGGRPLVDYPGNAAGAPLPALTTALYGADAVGRQAALLFAEGDGARPVIVGLVRAPGEPVPGGARLAELDGERLVLKAKQEIVLECGRASITLTRAGKVLIRGAYLSSRSSGVHRIKGASVDIN
ncbi:MAG TPA: DUF6484 domain-containing protein [Stellaceae bacterium]|nr:DUF6484 domain-containing protein [Stellaceae bacterium]